MSVDSRPNIVLVTIDSLRADHCGFMGYDRDTTPTLDEMAANGTVFENAIAPGPSTPESMPVIFTGSYPPDIDLKTASLLERRRERIRRHMKTRETLAQRLSRRGYETAAFTPNPFTSRHFGFEEGFDHFEDFMGQSRTRGELYDRIFDGFVSDDSASSLARMLLNFWEGEEVFKPWETYYDEVVEWASQADKPYFLWVFLMDAHNPYMAGPEFRSQSRWKTFHANYRFWRESHETPFSPRVHDRLVTAYDDAIGYADAFLGRLRADLSGDDPVVVVAGDHGEAFGEHGSYGHGPYLYEENVHVPLTVSGHGVSAREISNPVSLRRMPILLDQITAGGPLDVSGQFVESRTLDQSKRAIRTESYKYISNGGDSRLYDVSRERDEAIVDGPGQAGFSVLEELLAERERELDRLSRAADSVTVQRL